MVGPLGRMDVGRAVRGGADFGVGDKRLKRRGRPAVMVAFLVWLTGHFMGWWG